MFITRNRNYLPWFSFGRQLDRVSSDFDKLFGRSASRIENVFPVFNIYANDEGAMLEAELPGVKVEDIEIIVSGNLVTVKGARKDVEVEKASNVRRERRSGEFSRTFELPYSIEPAKVEAKCNKGILRVTMPRAEADKPKRIAVQAS